MIFQKIIVPLDGSEHSKRALEAAVQIAKGLNSKLMLLTVYSVMPAPAVGPEVAMVAIEHSRDFGKKVLAEAEEKVRSEKIEVETELAEGNAVEVIVKKSKEGTFDMIVMGARGLSTIKKIFVGSVSEGVIKKAPCPVLIVK
jgi:nucleotide-binding universal stress UspA family protein